MNPLRNNITITKQFFQFIPRNLMIMGHNPKKCAAGLFFSVGSLAFRQPANTLTANTFRAL
jgi:hypothetical protein